MRGIDNTIQFGIEPPASLERLVHITSEMFEKYVEGSNLFLWYYEYYEINYPDREENKTEENLNYRNSAIFYNPEISNEIDIPLYYLDHNGTIKWTIPANKDNWEIYKELFDWAKSIGADMYYDIYGSCTLITDAFLEKLRIKLGSKKLSKEKVLDYTIDSEGRFMAIHADDDAGVLSFLKQKMPKSVSKRLVITEKSWDDAFSLVQDDELIITPSIGGWVFISGLLLHRILPASNKEDDTDAFLDGINQLSKKFKKACWFEFSSKYSIKAYIKSEKGTIKYGVIHTEEENRVIGTKPRELGKDDNPDINFIASKWALDPDTFLYMPVLKDAKVSVMKLEGEMFF